MKKLLTTAVMAAALSAGTGNAQVLKFDDGTLQLLGCYKASEGVMCDFSWVAEKNGWSSFDRANFKVLTLGGESIDAEAIFASGQRRSSYGFDAYAGAPFKVSTFFPMKTVPAQLRVLAYAGNPIYNVAVRNGAPAPAVNVLKIDGTQFNAELTECEVRSNNVLYCKAMLTPQR